MESLKLVSQANVEWWPSPAKINLFLHICGRYENGYHELQTLFQLLDHGDQIGIEINDSSKITLADSIEGVNTEDNLIYKAARLLLEYRPNSSIGANIYLRKRIPMGGGLGGGSSNAATVLVALNSMWHCQLGQTALLALGKSLGADVPVFVNGYSAFAEGIGDKLTNTQISPAYYLVATPPQHISTHAIFTHPDLPRNSCKLDINDYKFALTKNDCEKLVCNLQPEVASLLNRLLHYAPSRMTGTGASVFAKFATLESATDVLQQLPDGVTAFIAKGVDVSPLHAKLAEFS
ncbi:MAG: 4-diphosphocytidyl-2-C-methyl-D-erythritol kinase [Alphaproteobacteria bacterium]|jgi:4-diphosphocytidyl-2-C-methyl-D-erythritol kinase